jgi:hypothetical protein
MSGGTNYLHTEHLKSLGWNHISRFGSIWLYCHNCREYNYHYHFGKSGDSLWLPICGICNTYDNHNNYIKENE